MKKYFIILLTVISSVNAQISGTIVSQKFKIAYGAVFGGYPGGVQINENEIVLGRFITDLDGNITGSIPAYLMGSYSFSPNGVYALSSSGLVLVGYDKMKSITNVKKEPTVAIDFTPQSKYGSTELCYSTPTFTGYLTERGGQSSYGVFVNRNFIHVVEKDKLLWESEIKLNGRRWDHLHTADGKYYAVYGEEGQLVLVTIDLATGKDQYLTLDKKYAFYSGAGIEVIGDQIVVTSFRGECDNKSDGYNYWDAVKNDGVMVFIIGRNEMKIIESDDISIPDEYAELVTSKKGYSSLTMNDILDAKSGDMYFLSGTTGDPFAIWKYSRGELSFYHTIKDKTYIRSGKLFNYEGKNYILYAIDAEKGNGYYMEKLKLAVLDSDGLTDIPLTITQDKQPEGSINLNNTYITSKGTILIPSDNRGDIGYLVRIQL